MALEIFNYNDNFSIKYFVKRKVKRCYGFTLIEIMIAIMVLAFSLTTLLGLQMSATDQAIRTGNKQHAMLMARRIMSAIEGQGGPLENSSETGDAKKILSGIMSIEDSEDKDTEKRAEVPLKADLVIKSWPIAGFPPDSLKEVTLKVYWSENPADSVEVIYFVPVQSNE